jgi:Na+-driven multidrug efflux pump
MGVEGLGLAYLATNVALFIVALVYTRYMNMLADVALAPDFESLRGFTDILAEALPSVPLFVLFVWTLELFVIFSGIMGTTQLAAAGQSIALIYFMKHIAIGIFDTMTTLTGNMMDEDQPKLAWKVYNLIFEGVCVFFIVLGIAVCFSRFGISKVMSDSVEV